MIRTLEAVKHFGIFEDFDGRQIKPFGRYNLIYGWNGSGKSTLSLIFESLEKRALVAETRFPQSTFRIAHEDGSVIDHQSVSACSRNIRTFNANFVRENIDWDSHAKSILIVAKENIEERRKLDALSVEQSTDSQKLTELRTALKNKEDAQSKFLTDSAKSIKLSLKVIDTSDNRFLNYDKSKFKPFLVSKEAAIKDPASILEEETLLSLTAAARPDKKAAIALGVQKLPDNKFSEIRERIVKLVDQSILSTTIERLANDPTLQAWVDSGLQLHRNKPERICEFCGGQLSDQRVKDLEAHFSKDYTEFKKKVLIAIEWIGKQKVSLTDIPSTESFYGELQKGVKDARRELESACAAINKHIDAWKVLIEQKQANVFRIDFQVQAISNEHVEDYNSAVQKLSDFVSKHNAKSAECEKSISKIKSTIELHYAAEAASRFGYFENQTRINTQEEAIRQLSTKIEQRDAQIKSLQASLINEELGAKKFNDALHRFLGRSDICLKFNPAKLGYEICREDGIEHTKYLSEGEKTAIAFVYFVLKLKENDNQLQKTIVVIDDPVSSFDSNHLFHAYAFLRERCGDAKQLFVLTHNFTFFRRVCDWFVGNNNNRKRREPPLEPNAFVYVAEATYSGRRTSRLIDAADDLIKYHSEYHYLFCRLLKVKEVKTPSLDQCYTVANLGRRILESFLSFKFPKSRTDFAQLLLKAQSSCAIIPREAFEKLRRFIDRYSHSNVFDVDSESLDNLISECPSVIETIMQVLKEVDPAHYEEMIEVSL